jgi:hypothetical protein
MRVIYLFLIFIGLCGVGFAHNNIEVDLYNNKIEVTDFFQNDLEIKGKFAIDFKEEEDGALVFNVEAQDVSFRGVNIPCVKSRIVKRSDIIFVDYVESSAFLIKGNIDLKQEQLSLDININSWEGEDFFKGVVQAEAKVWGKLDDFLVSGCLNIENGTYRNREFSHLSLQFLGKPPLLNLTDSRCILKNGSIYKIEGTMNLADFGNLFPGAKFVSRKVSLGGWEFMFEDQKNAGLKKGIDNKFDVVFDTYEKDNSFMEGGAELRYNLNGDEFLRWRMQDDKTIVGFERRKEF